MYITIGLNTQTYIYADNKPDRMCFIDVFQKCQENVKACAESVQYLQEKENRGRMVNIMVVKTEDVLYSLHKCNCHDLVLWGWWDKIFRNCCNKCPGACSFMFLTYIINVSGYHYVTIKEMCWRSRHLDLILPGKEDRLLSCIILNVARQSFSWSCRLKAIWKRPVNEQVINQVEKYFHFMDAITLCNEI